MKKIGLFLLTFLFSLGVIAQTTPATAPANVKPASTTSSSMTGKASKKEASATTTGASKNNLKKTGVNKKVTHHVTPVKKSTTPAVVKDASKDNLKK